MKTMIAMVVGTVLLLTTGIALAQGGNMMDGGGGMGGWGWMGGYGGVWLPVLVIVAVVGLVAWFVTQRRK